MKALSEMISEMTAREKVGQLFLAHCPAEGIGEAVATYQPGGLLLFARDFETDTPDSVREKITAWNGNAKLPLLIAADEEGGTVVRASKFPQYGHAKFESPKELFSRVGWDGIEEDGADKARFLLSLGVNYDLAPVCDYTLDEEKYIAKRVFGRSPEESAEFIRRTVRGMTKEGILCSLKHFPGYGGNSDTHKGMARDLRPLSVFEQEDLLPFRAGIEAGAQSVMVSHNIVHCFDPDYPASLSPAVHRYLREVIGFDGVIITDSMTMGGIREFTEEDPCTQALLCGNDMLITSYWRDGMKALYESVDSGKVPMEVLDRAVMRVLRMKRSIGLI